MASDSLSARIWSTSARCRATSSGHDADAGSARKAFTASSTAPNVGVCEVANLDIGLRTFTIEPNSAGLPDTTVSVAVLGSQTVVANAVLGATQGGLTVGIYNTAGQGVSGVSIVVTDANGGTASCAATNTSGVCTVTGLPLGTVSVTASKTGYLPIRGTATITAGGGSLSLTAVSSNAIAVFVVEDDFNQPVSGATITVTGGGG